MKKKKTFLLAVLFANACTTDSQWLQVLNTQYIPTFLLVDCIWETFLMPVPQVKAAITSGDKITYNPYEDIFEESERQPTFSTFKGGGV